MEKRFEWLLFLVAWLPTTAFFVIQSISNLAVFVEVIGYSIFALGGFIVLLNFKTDEPYYRNLTLFGLILAILTGLLMFLFAEGLGAVLGGNLLKESAVFSPLSNMGVNSLATLPSSVSTSFLSDLLFTFLIVAGSEEIFKFAIFAGLQIKVRWYVAAIPAVLIWSFWHLIAAYPTFWLVIPVLINGFILIFLLQYTKNFLAPIVGHGVYNGIIILLQYINGQSPIKGPWFPTAWTASDIAVVGLWVLVICIVILPVMLNRRSKNR